MIWQIKLAALLLTLAALFGGYKWVGHNAVSEYKAEQAVEQAKVDKVQAAKYDAVAQELEDLKLKRAANAKIIYKETERVIQSAPVVYSASCWTDSGLLNANSAISGNPGKPSPEVQAN